jgi:hypothetical protein
MKRTTSTIFTILVTATVTAGVCLGLPRVLSGSKVLSADAVTGTDTSSESNRTASDGVNQTGTTSTPSEQNNSQPTNSSGNSQQPSLVPFSDGLLTVNVPANWSKGPIQGGNFSGWKFVNPDDPNQQLTLITSSCVGCASNQKLFLQGIVKPDPTALLPTTTTQHYLFNNGLSAGYTFRDAKGNPYQGNGVVTVTEDKNGNVSGYIQVEVFLPDAQKSLATEILNSVKTKTQ